MGEASADSCEKSKALARGQGSGWLEERLVNQAHPIRQPVGPDWV